MYMYMCICMCISMCICMCICLCMCTCTCTCVYTYIYIYTYNMQSTPEGRPGAAPLAQHHGLRGRSPAKEQFSMLFTNSPHHFWHQQKQLFIRMAFANPPHKLCISFARSPQIPLLLNPLLITYQRAKGACERDARNAPCYDWRCSVMI